MRSEVSPSGIAPSQATEVDEMSIHVHPRDLPFIFYQHPLLFVYTLALIQLLSSNHCLIPVYR